MFMNFPEKVNFLRNKRGLTTEELAKLANVSKTSISFYETGKRKPHRNTQFQLAKVLCVKVDDLMDDEKEVS